MAKVCPKCGREFENSRVKCPICKIDLVSDGIDNSESARLERLERLRQQQGRAQGAQPRQTQAATQTRQNSGGTPTAQRSLQAAPIKDGPSGLSITALVFSLSGCFSVVGLVLGIVDLCINKHRKKVCSVLALVFSGLWIIGMAAFLGGSDTPNRPKVAGNPSNRISGQTNSDSYNDSPTQYSVGNTISGDGWKITLESAKMYDEIRGEYYNDVPADGKKYLVLFFEVENVSNKDDYFNYLYLESYLDGYSTNFVMTMNAPEGYGELAGDVAAGKKMKGCLKYEVSPSWSELEVSYKEWIGTSDKIATFVVTPGNVR